MSPLIIVLLITAAVVVLAVIAFINHSMEQARLQRMRLKAECTDRIRRLMELSELFPGQFMTPELKAMLIRLELHFAQKLNEVDKGSQNSRIAELSKILEKPNEIAVNNAKVRIDTEAKAKKVKQLLEVLMHQIQRATQEGLVAQKEAKHWAKEIRNMLVKLHIQLFSTQGEVCLQKEQPRQARLAFERGVTFLKKQPDIDQHQPALAEFEARLAKANAMVMDQDKVSAEENSALGEAVEDLEQEQEWKKKTF
ncbi:hypothetical protein [Atopomonas sediminilitoris]|uniref:hypothetical protein n=1 Tax=Atopomonas sediminilitoris TaxID=2919919 RepID=UPI001F4D600B|nr:hypothetical protein [Atopomonas sediminilitoris]MCJ8168064.1 hypothetical protein [Atopomonas sediminilitoris]